MGDQLAQIRSQLDEPLLGPGSAVPHSPGPEHQDHHVVGPVLETVPILSRHTHHLGNDHRGNGIGEILDQIELLPIGQVVDQLIHHAIDSFPPGLHCPRGKRSAHQPAQSRVVRRIPEHQPVHQDVIGGLALCLLLVGQAVISRADAFRGETGIPQSVEHVVVAVDEPRPVFLIPVDGVFGPENREIRVRIGDPLGR